MAADESLKAMRRLLLTVACAVLEIVSSRAADAIYHNIATVACDNAPQIDAQVFVNDGSFCALPITGSLFGANPGIPYTTQNTLWFTNNGLLQSGPGFWLDYVTADGIHHPAAAIVNSAGGASGPANIFGSEFLFLSATNLINKGLLEIGGSGLMQLSGNSLDLARGGLLVDPVNGGGACVPESIFFTPPEWTPTNFFPISGLVFDEYWGEGAVTNLASDQIVQQRGASLVVQSPGHVVTNRFGAGAVVVGPIASPSVFVRTNALSPTNLIVQAVFVGSSLLGLDTNIQTQVKWINNEFPENVPANNGFRTAVVELKSVFKNTVTGQPITYGLYILDQLPTSTNLTSITNRTTGVTQRPMAYYVDVYPPCSFLTAAVSTNAPFTPSLIYNSSFSNRVVSANYAGYEAFLNTVAPGGVLPTNTPGRIEITASNLDLTRTRIRGESIVTIKTPHLEGSSGLLVDAPNVNYNIGSTNGLLSVSGNDLAIPQIQRFGGLVTMWSGFWTNQSGMVVTNIGPDPNDPSMTVTNLATNVVEAAVHVLIVNAGGITTTAQVLLNDFSVNSSNSVLNDTIEVGGAFSALGGGLTVNGSLTLDTSNWGSTNANLKSLTNNGTITVPDVMELGNTARPYAAVVNNTGGAISSFAITINSDYFQDSGTMTAGGFLDLNTRSGKLEGGALTAGNNLSISAQDLKLLGYRQSSATFYLAVTNSLYDPGAGADNKLTCNNGFNLLIKPKSGDLLGTTLQAQAGQFQEMNNVWAAEDRGVSSAGYSNNVALGRLAVSAQDSSFVTFSGAGSNNAIYADFLELSGAAQTDVQSVLAIDTNLVIYFADANVPVDTIDGKFADSLKPGGRLRWVRDFAGPNSSVDVLLANGQTSRMNRALRFSAAIDTDGDGVPNAYDCYPTDPTAWNCSAGGSATGAAVSVANGVVSRVVSVSWTGLPSGVWSAEYTTSLSQPNWKPLPTYTNITITNGVLAVQDTNVLSSDAERYYRLRFGP